MLCPKCGKESNNLRVCAFCHTPYPIDRDSQSTPRSSRAAGTPRGSAAVGAGDPRVAMARRARIKRWGAIGVLAAFTIGFYLFTRDRVIPAGVALPNLITIPMSANDAARMVKAYEGETQVDPRDGSVTVHIPAKTFPERRDGQLALAQQYARADEIVMGRKRLISFIDPGGVQFAKADPTTGVMMTR